METFVSSKRDLFYFSTQQLRKGGFREPFYERCPIKVTIRKQDLDNGYTIILRNFYDGNVIEMIQTRSLENDTPARTEFYGFANYRQGTIFWDSVLSIGLAYTNQSGVYIVPNIFDDFGKDYLESSEENLLEFLSSSAYFLKGDNLDENNIFVRMRFFVIKYLLEKFGAMSIPKIKWISPQEKHNILTQPYTERSVMAMLDLIQSESDRCAKIMWEGMLSNNKQIINTYSHNIAMLTANYQTIYQLLSKWKFI